MRGGAWAEGEDPVPDRKEYICMKFPFDNMIDDALSHYTLQFNLYRRMLESVGIKIGDMRLIWLKEDGDYEIKDGTAGELATFTLEGNVADYVEPVYIENADDFEDFVKGLNNNTALVEEFNAGSNTAGMQSIRLQGRRTVQSMFLQILNLWI